MDMEKQPVCPECSSDPGVAAASLAPDQAVFPNGKCPVNSCQTDKRLKSESCGSYLPADAK